ncbi:hypothetical protein [Aedoeadaptatus coli]|uniref:hypothetical protein n=1 Tax=Aedoeadaptatus coli TaxID=2058292 RepID=UPI000D55C07E|nr:hypothetical protein [Peptoniphilus coli]
MRIIEIIKNLIFRTPKNKLSYEDMVQIKEKGLVHFTDKCNVNSIINEGIKPCPEKSMRRSEREFTWFYMNQSKKDIMDKYNTIKTKGRRASYDVYFIIKNLSDDQMKNMLYREYDKAIVHKGVLKTDDMEYYSVKDFDD